MKNKIIPIILIFVMSLSSSVFAGEIDNISLEEAKQIKNMATLEYNRKGDSYGKYWTENVTDVQFQNYWNGNIKNIINYSWYKDFVNNADWSWDKSNFTVMYGSTGQFYIMYTGKLKISETDTTVIYIDGLRPGSTNYLIANTSQFDTYNMTKTYTKNNDGTLTQTNIGGAFSNTRYQAIITVKSDGTIYHKTGRYGAELYGYFEQTDDEEKFSNHCLYSFTEPKNIYLYPKGQSYFKEGLLYNELPKDITDSDSTSDVPNYDYTGNDYWENHNKPYFSYSHLNGYMNATEEKPDYLDSLSYSGKYYFNLPFYIFNDPLSTYDFTHDILRLGVYSVTNESGDNKYKLLDYFDASAGAVYITGETGTDLYGGWDRYMYDLFGLYNYDGKLDNFVDTYGKNGLAFRLFLYTPFNEEVANSYYIVLNGDLVSAGTNKPTQDIVFDENAGFFELLESSKSFISRFLSFFDIFPSWLTSLLATAITVAIICRLIGR